MASEFSYELRIPRDRVAVLIGTNGDSKKQLEKSTNTLLLIDSQEGVVRIDGNDALAVFSAREIIQAIGRGFNPEIARQLLKQDYGLEIVPITDFAKTQEDMTRLKGRVIGEEGKSRRTIEDLTDTSICVYGKTVGIIGDFDSLTGARRAVESLLSGSPHASVYKWLEKRRKEVRRRQLIEV